MKVSPLKLLNPIELFCLKVVFIILLLYLNVVIHEKVSSQCMSDVLVSDFCYSVSVKFYRYINFGTFYSEK